MGKPTEQELKQALEAAAVAREQGRDQHFVAKSLLHCHYENQYLREVLHAVEAYLRSGLSETEHAVLLKAVEHARREDHRNMGDSESLGL